MQVSDIYNIIDGNLSKIDKKNRYFVGRKWLYELYETNTRKLQLLVV